MTEKMNADIYISWCPGLPDDKEALQILKDSDHVAGIELSNTDESAGKIRRAGLKTSIHNILRNHKATLADEDFITVLNHTENAITTLQDSDAPVAGFHATTPKNNEHSKERLISLLKENAAKAAELTGKQIAIETSVYRLQNTHPMKAYTTSPDFLRDIVAHTEAGILLDVSHFFISQHTRAVKEKRKFDLHNDVIDEIKTFAERIVQVHLNVPTKIDAGYDDFHTPFSEDGEMTEIILEICRNICAMDNNIKVITLEMDTGKAPAKHAEMMAEQARFFTDHVLNHKC